MEEGTTEVTMTPPAHDIKLTCGVYVTGESFTVATRLNEDVDGMIRKIADELDARPRNLRVYVAKETGVNGGWLRTHSNLRPFLLAGPEWGETDAPDFQQIWPSQSLVSEYFGLPLPDDALHILAEVKKGDKKRKTDADQLLVASTVRTRDPEK
ncbi:uncharacterized protein IUM83_01214 [Phytophthora cinnamomi]|uniref:uncharacterized protein n=1 Tax=Phytophthora cinnamomi TaxID=4785 RepID=UPI0035596833|nr:hypothetical protein IUM83_01214 [Phytophthora cinnamomi]